MSKVNSKIAKAWSKSVGREIAFEVKEVEAADGRKQTQLYNPENGSLVVAVNLVGEDAEKKLVENAGVSFIDPAFDWLEIEGPNQGNQINKADNDVATPSDRPGAAIEAKKDKDAGALAEDK